MNEQRADIVFSIAEECISKWLAGLVNKSVDDLFNGDSISKTTRPLYINKSFKRFYEIKPIIVPYDYNCNFDIINENKEAKEAVGFVMYSIKTIFRDFRLSGLQCYEGDLIVYGERYYTNSGSGQAATSQWFQAALSVSFKFDESL
jgi:hypothetical protein